MRAGLLSHVDFLCGSWRPFQQGRIAEVVVDDDFCALEAGATFDREESRVARPSANEVADASFHEGGKVRRINLPSSMIAQAAMAT
jgi:hypothetical protein